MITIYYEHYLVWTEYVGNLSESLCQSSFMSTLVSSQNPESKQSNDTLENNSTCISVSLIQIYLQQILLCIVTNLCLIPSHGHSFRLPPQHFLIILLTILIFLHHLQLQLEFLLLCSSSRFYLLDVFVCMKTDFNHSNNEIKL